MAGSLTSWGRVLLAALLAAGLAGCGSRRLVDDGVALGPGDHEISLAHGGRTRLAIVHVPERSGGAPLPLVLAFHGGGGEAAGFQASAGLDAVADREGFIVVYPYGTGPLARRLLTWNSGSQCCGYALEQNVDDVGFVAALVAEVSRRVPVDARRVYATGHSNGSMMSHRLAAERAELFAAVVPVGGAMDLDAFSPSLPVPVLHIHSVDDPRALYEGGLGPPFPLTDNRVEHRPVSEGLGRWAARNGCAGGPAAVESRSGEPGTPNAGQTATRLAYPSCTGAPVEHWRLTGVGHGWPGHMDRGIVEAIIGPPTTLVDAAEEAWRFFRRFAR